MKKTLYFAAAAISAALIAMPAYAATDAEVAAAIAQQSPSLTYVSNILVSNTKSNETFLDRVDRAVAEVYPGCSIWDVVSEYWYNDSSRWYYTDGLAALADYQEAVDEWAENAAREITEVYDEAGNPVQLTKYEVIEKAVEYMKDNYEYRTWYYPDADSDVSGEQGAYSLITTGEGVCAGFSRAFNCLVETVPFNEEGYVDWENGTDHIDVKIANNRSYSHTINAIDLNDGEGYRYFDVSSLAMGLATEKREGREYEIFPDQDVIDGLCLL